MQEKTDRNGVCEEVWPSPIDTIYNALRRETILSKGSSFPVLVSRCPAVGLHTFC